MKKSFLLGVLVAMTACGDDGGGMTVMADAMVDAVPAKVVEIGCPLTPAATVMSTDANDTSYMPMATMIAAGGIVKFVMSPTHDAAPNPITTSDPALTVDFGETKCLKFNTPGTYGFYCTTHAFAGTVTVQ